VQTRKRAPANAAQEGFSLQEIAARNGCGLTKIYDEINAGRLRARKLGKRTIVFVADEAAWRAALPLYPASSA
jgi:hypothetical protein